MGRADDIRARMAAEIELAEAEDALAAAKSNKKMDPADLGAIKDDLRSKRQAFREQRDGDASAAPSTIKASAGVKKSGGN